VPDPVPFKEQEPKNRAIVSAHVHNFSINFLTALAKPVLPGGYWQANARTGDDSKTLNLTYDDGPNPATTGPLLDLLAEEGIKATFFFIGENIQRHPDLVEQVFRNGHTVGNHSLSHPFMPGLTRARMAVEIDETNRLIEEIIGEKPHLFRPPYGIIDARGARLLEDRRMSAVYWGAVTQDWRNIGEEAVVEHIIKRLPFAPLIVMHEGHDIADQCLKATASILLRVKQMGYKFAAIK
jgi:peptidoglycan/xylan/chitin deacetylase (PgdA/CDA1 family)